MRRKKAIKKEKKEIKKEKRQEREREKKVKISNGIVFRVKFHVTLAKVVIQEGDPFRKQTEKINKNKKIK